MAKPMLRRITIQIMMVFGPSMSKESSGSSLLWLTPMDFSLVSALGSGLAAFTSTGFGVTTFTSGMGLGAGLGCLLGAGLDSALLGGLLPSLDSDTDGEGAGLGSGVAALADALDAGRDVSFSSACGTMRLFLADAGALGGTLGGAGEGVALGSLASANF